MKTKPVINNKHQKVKYVTIQLVLIITIYINNIDRKQKQKQKEVKIPKEGYDQDHIPTAQTSAFASFAKTSAVLCMFFLTR